MDVRFAVFRGDDGLREPCTLEHPVEYTPPPVKPGV